MRHYNGIAENVNSSILGQVTRNRLSIFRGKSVLVAQDVSLISAKGFACLITNSAYNKSSLPYVKVSLEVMESLEEGDCVLINKDGSITVVWDKKDSANSLLLTEKCDCRCIICPQPPKVHDKQLMEISKQILNIVKIRSTDTICLTGGEPTLLKDDLFNILDIINKKHPKATVMMLTNGKSFADLEFTKNFISVRPKNFLTCVSLHSDVDEIHDRIVGVKGSFYKTAMGIQNLARFREKIEIRIVVNRFNAQCLESFATFIQRNFPFVYHSAFMGMEITGLACDNYDSIWIDPYEYRDQISKAMRVLNRADMNVSIYNLPLCLLDRKSWKFARKSISIWKNDYLPICKNCAEMDHCCGIFTTSGLHQSPYISPPININKHQ